MQLVTTFIHLASAIDIAWGLTLSVLNTSLVVITVVTLAAVDVAAAAATLAATNVWKAWKVYFESIVHNASVEEKLETEAFSFKALRRIDKDEACDRGVCEYIGTENASASADKWVSLHSKAYTKDGDRNQTALGKCEQ